MYFICDVTQDDINLEQLKSFNCTYISLYKVKDDTDLNVAIPYLVPFEKEDGCRERIITNFWGNAVGVFVFSKASLDDLFDHFRRFLIVKDEEGKKMYFHFYNPHVLRIFLPTCDNQQLKDFFGPIEKFICEDEDPAFAHLFSFDGRQLITKRVAADTIFSATKEAPFDQVSQRVNDDTNKSNTELPLKKLPRRFFY